MIDSFIISYNKATQDNCPAMEKEYSDGNCPKKNILKVVYIVGTNPIINKGIMRL